MCLLLTSSPWRAEMPAKPPRLWHHGQAAHVWGHICQQAGPNIRLVLAGHLHTQGIDFWRGKVALVSSCMVPYWAAGWGLVWLQLLQATCTMNGRLQAG